MSRSVLGALIVLAALTGPYATTAAVAEPPSISPDVVAVAPVEVAPVEAETRHLARGMAAAPEAIGSDTGGSADQALAEPAGESLAEPAPPGRQSGYHHLGATTAGSWGGVMGRLTVTDPGVRPGTYDFVAARFMARSPDGTVWLEAGWSENGWLNDGRQRIYSYDTIRRQWRFFDEYKVRPGDQVWVYLESATGRDGKTSWRAWLWWGTRWHLLAEERLSLGATATMEQYLEVYVDPARDGTFPLPASSFDNVRVRTADGGLTFWQEAGVPSGTSTTTGRYCVTWATRFDTWSAADCP